MSETPEPAAVVRYDVAVRMPDGKEYLADDGGRVQYVGEEFYIARPAHERTTPAQALNTPSNDGMGRLVLRFRQQVERLALPEQPDPVRVLRKVTEVREAWFEAEAGKP